MSSNPGDARQPAAETWPGRAIVAIAPTDVAFESISCQPWERVR